MAQTCDLCGATNCHLSTLLDQYQTPEVKELCSDCERWANKTKGDLLLEISPRMRAAITERKGAPPPAPPVAWWRRVKDRLLHT